MSGGLLLSRIEYRSINQPSVVNVISDAINFSATKSTEIKNNMFTINLKNSINKYDGTYLRGNNVLASGNIQYQEEDEFKLYLKLTNDPSDYGATWYSSDELVGEFVVEEYNMMQTADNSRITMKAVDRAFLLFNAVYTRSFGTGTNFTTPGIFRNIIRYHGEKSPSSITNYTGTNNDTGTEYRIDARFVSEGGSIKDYRTTTEGGPTTQLDGALNDSDVTITVDSTTGFKSAGTIVITDGTTTEHVSYTGVTGTTFTGCTRAIDDTKAVSHLTNTDIYQGFPLVELSKTWKPIYEWLGEISQTPYTNYSDEQGEGNTPFYNRAFLFWLDETNGSHFMPADNDVDLNIELGDDQFKNMRLQKSVFDSINYVIYNCGSDMYGNGVLWYWYDQSSEVSTFKMRYQPYNNIINNLLNKDLKVNSTRATATQDKFKQFPSAGSYPLSSWGFKKEQNEWESLQGDSLTTSITNDSEYNAGIRNAAKWVGLSEAKRLTSRLSGLRYKGSGVIHGQIVNPGDLITITNRFTGIITQRLRVLSVTHNVRNNAWTTTLDVEEDEKVV